MAEAFAERISPRVLWLTGLTAISDEVAERMGQHNGYLRLSGLERITDRQIELLAAHHGYLGLSGLKQLSTRAATALGQHDGMLGLNGLTALRENKLGGSEDPASLFCRALLEGAFVRS